MNKFLSRFEEIIKPCWGIAEAKRPSLGLFHITDAEAPWLTILKDWMKMMFGSVLKKNGLEADAEPQETFELIGWMSWYSGIPAVARAMKIWQERLILQQG